MNQSILSTPLFYFLFYVYYYILQFPFCQLFFTIFL
nr:MAG TPA: hypothetical protein [Caudoviricetes sp.]